MSLSHERGPTERKESTEMTRQYQIAKKTVEFAWKQVKEKGGAAGVDNESIKDFEGDLEGNLYKIWNRMTSGSYFPPAVKEVEIPKRTGGMRKLGIPTVADRVAQTVAKLYIEPLVEPTFHTDSYGYRPKRSQHNAIEIARNRCWKYDWVLEIDIKGYFDNIDHDLMLELLQGYTVEPWVVLYVQRWLKADVQGTGGTTHKREKGSPQGSVISPVLSNIFLHHAFDAWMANNHSNNPFERYADDIIVHCSTLEQACRLKESIAARLAEWKLTINEEKSRIVYCKDSGRPGDNEPNTFTFMGYTFKPRRAVNRKTGEPFTSFQPAIGHQAQMDIYESIRNWKLSKRIHHDLEDICKDLRPEIRGWWNYFGKFYKSALDPVADHIDAHLVRWAVRKFKRLKESKRKGYQWLTSLKARSPELLPHWLKSRRVTRAV